MEPSILHTDNIILILRTGTEYIILHMDPSVVVTGAQALHTQLLPQVEPPCKAIPWYFVSAIPSPPTCERRRRAAETETVNWMKITVPSSQCSNDLNDSVFWRPSATRSPGFTGSSHARSSHGGHNSHSSHSSHSSRGIRSSHVVGRLVIHPVSHEALACHCGGNHNRFERPRPEICFHGRTERGRYPYIRVASSNPPSFQPRRCAFSCNASSGVLQAVN